jgi:outer membrane protein assembly factor BamE (lipoprotein component of BamABCDE complex)
VNDFLKVGLDKKAVVAKFGEPLAKDTDQNGVETYDYPKPPDKIPKEENFVYGGFQVFFAKNKVTGFSISHRTVRVPPKNEATNAGEMPTQR